MASKFRSIVQRLAVEQQNSPTFDPWSVATTASFLMASVPILMALFIPEVLASYAEAMIAPQWVLIVLRWAFIALCTAVLLTGRSIPLQKRIYLVIMITAVAMNYSRNQFTTTPLTLSFAFLLVGLCLDTVSLLMRPTIYEQLVESQKCCKEQAETIKENEKLIKRYESTISRQRLDIEDMEAVIGSSGRRI